MQRRDFFRIAAASAVAAASPISSWPQDGAANPASSQTESKRPKALPKLGTQHGDSPEILTMMAALGVSHICAEPISRNGKDDWSVEGLSRKREQIESFGLTPAALRLLHPNSITSSEVPHVMLGKSPERDREIDTICAKIRSAARAGFPMLTYNLTILGAFRSGSVKGRGGATYSAFNYDKVTDRDKLTEAGVVSADESWERIEYFVKRVMPVAEEYKVRMALHPEDPAVPEPQGIHGVHRVLGNVAGLKRFIDLSLSSYHGLNFCQGTVCESLKNPNEEIHDVIRYFGTRGRIFNVHFRNINGGFLNFQESLPDNGDVNFIRAIRTYKEVGYDGMLMPDHVPKIEGDPDRYQAFAFCFGYIRALIQMVSQEG